MNLVEMKTAHTQLVNEVKTLVAEMQADAEKDTPETLAIVEQKTKDAAALYEKIKTFENAAGLAVTVTEGKGRQTEEPAAVIEPAQVTPRHPAIQSVGDQFVNSELYKKNSGKGFSMPANTRIQFDAKGILGPKQLKATFDTATTGLETYYNYQAGPIMVEQQRLTIRDLLAQGQTTLNTIPYIKETSFTNAAATVAEEGEKPEASFALEDATAPVRKIAVIARVTDEMWNDFPMLRDYVNQRLRFMVEQEEEDQLLNGAGTGSSITGILNTSGIQTQALGGDTIADAIFKAMTKIRVTGFFEPDGIVIHPNDWQTVRLAKDANNQYYGGGPFTGAYGNGGGMAPDMLWGKRVVVTTAIAENTALVGAFRLGAQIWQREGIRVEATNSHEDDFQFNRIAIRVEERLALTVYRPLAFSTVTGI
jgi:HK97 family phage major capsid protein